MKRAHWFRIYLAATIASLAATAVGDEMKTSVFGRGTESAPAVSCDSWGPFHVCSTNDAGKDAIKAATASARRDAIEDCEIRRHGRRDTSKKAFSNPTVESCYAFGNDIECTVRVRLTCFVPLPKSVTGRSDQGTSSGSTYVIDPAGSIPSETGSSSSGGSSSSAPR